MALGSSPLPPSLDLVEEAPHPGHELLGRERLHQVVVSADLEGVDDVGHAVTLGEDDHRDVARARIVLEVAAELEAVHHRHLDVGEDEIDVAVRHPGEGLRAVADDDDTIAVRLQGEPDHLGLGSAVLGDEDERGGGRVLGCGER